MDFQSYYKTLERKYLKKFLCFLLPLYGLFFIGVLLSSISHTNWGFETYLDAKMILGILSFLNSIVFLVIGTLSFDLIDESTLIQFYLIRKDFQKNILRRVITAGIANGFLHLVLSLLLQWKTTAFPLSVGESILVQIFFFVFFSILFPFIYYLNRLISMLISYYHVEKTPYFLLEVGFFILFYSQLFTWILKLSKTFFNTNIWLRNCGISIFCLFLGTVILFFFTYCLYQKTDIKQIKN